MKTSSEIIEEIERLVDAVAGRITLLESVNSNDPIRKRYEKEIIEIRNDILRLEWVLE